jgi:putative mycofactocin binding protein MftB
LSAEPLELEHQVSVEADERPPTVHFDFDRAWQLSRQVSVRPERFGALLYHFGTRRLVFCKDLTLATVLLRLESAPSARDACIDAGVSDADLPGFAAALGKLAESTTIVERARIS